MSYLFVFYKKKLSIFKFAQPIRLLLAFAGVPLEEKRYNFNMTDLGGSEWFDEKFTLGLDFPNVRN